MPLIFSSILPSPGFEATSRGPFEALNTELYNICIQSGGVSTYFDAASFLTSPEGHILIFIKQMVFTYQSVALIS